MCDRARHLTSAGNSLQCKGDRHVPMQAATALSLLLAMHYPIAFNKMSMGHVCRSVHALRHRAEWRGCLEALTEQYSNMPSKTGQSASPTGPRLKRRICAMYSSWLSGVTLRRKST